MRFVITWIAYWGFRLRLEERQQHELGKAANKMATHQQQCDKLNAAYKV